MEINEEKTVDMLSTESVSILTRKVLIDGEVKSQVGENHRRTYLNSVSGREELLKEQTENVVNAVFAIWGSEPVVEEPIIEEEDEDYGENNNHQSNNCEDTDNKVLYAIESSKRRKEYVAKDGEGKAGSLYQ